MEQDHKNRIIDEIQYWKLHHPEPEKRTRSYEDQKLKFIRSLEKKYGVTNAALSAPEKTTFEMLRKEINRITYRNQSLWKRPILMLLDMFNNLMDSRFKNSHPGIKEKLNPTVFNLPDNQKAAVDEDRMQQRYNALKKDLSERGLSPIFTKECIADMLAGKLTIEVTQQAKIGFALAEIGLLYALNQQTGKYEARQMDAAIQKDLKISDAVVVRYGHQALNEALKTGSFYKALHVGELSDPTLVDLATGINTLRTMPTEAERLLGNQLMLHYFYGQPNSEILFPDIRFEAKANVVNLSLPLNAANDSPAVTLQQFLRLTNYETSPGPQQARAHSRETNIDDLLRQMNGPAPKNSGRLRP